MKNSYILLRNNKENGPYNLAQLETIGLKRDDLVWVEGQSVAWLRPGEIAELRSVISPVAPASSLSADSEKYTENITGEIPVTFENIPEKKKSVFVSMPPDQTSHPDKVNSSILATSSTKAVSDDPAVPETKYSQPLDEIKDMYVKRLQERKEKSIRSKNLVKYLKRAAIFIGLPVVGAITGITLQKSFKKNAPLIQTQKLQQPASPELIPGNVDQQVSASTVVDEERVLGKDKSTVSPTATVQKTEKTQEPVTVNKVATDRDENSPEQIPVVGANSSPGHEERNSKSRNEATRSVSMPDENISSLVAVKSNNYKTGSFGGVRDLQLTVTNDSKYALENVLVELQYLNLDEEIIKTQTIHFTAVPANGSKTIAIARSNRGVKIACKILKVEPKAAENIAGF